jgi:hypothetical protein
MRNYHYKNYQSLKKVIAIVVMGAFLFHVNISSNLHGQSEEELVKQFHHARQRYINGQYINAKVRLERVISIILDTNVERDDILGQCYLLLGAIYEKEDKPMLAEENYRKAKDKYDITSVEGVDLCSLPLYRKLMKCEELPAKGTIVKIGKEKKKKFPWLLVAGGVVVVGAVLYFLVLKPKKKYTLSVVRGEGVEGEPTNGTYEYKKGTPVNYGYTSKAGYSNLAVVLDGVQVTESGLIVMDKNHSLKANADANMVSFVTDKERVEIDEGGTATFNVRLSAQPQGEVDVNVSHREGDEDIKVLVGETLTFTPSNWNTFKPVVLQAVEDADSQDGEAVIRIRAPDTPGIEPKDITAVEIDKHSLNFVTDRDTVSIQEGGTGSFRVKLSAAIFAGVTAEVRNQSGDEDIIVRPGKTLTFSPGDWNKYQEVTLEAREDTDTDNGQAVIRISAPGIPDKDITAKEIDKDSLNFITDKNEVSIEEGKTAAFQVKLSAQPSANVDATVRRVSGDSDISVDLGSELTFTPVNWNSFQTVTLKAVEDVDVTNGKATVRISAGGITDKDILVTEVDKDSLNFVTDTNELSIVEGETASFKVKLSANPLSDLTASISKLSGSDDDITVQPPDNLTFTSTDWNIFQTVTLNAARDEDDENGQAAIRVRADDIPSTEITVTESDTGTGEEPSVSIKEPKNGALIPEDVEIVAVADDDFGIQRVELYIDGVFQDSDSQRPYDFSWSTREVTVGTHQIKVIAYDAIDQYDEDEITVTVSDEPPKELSIQVLPDQTPVSGTVEITVSAGDYRGIQTINVFIDDELLKTWNEGPLSAVDFKFSLDTTQYADDDYIIKAVAIDTANQEKAVEIIINVQNQSSVVSIFN